MFINSSTDWLNLLKKYDHQLNKGKLDEITLFQDEFDLKKLDFHLCRTFKTRT
jgi:hypothetical protein